MSLYAEIVVPVAHAPFTFRVPEGMEDVVVPGVGVEVQLGDRKRYMGIVWSLTQAPPPFCTKDISRILTARPLLDTAQMTLWEWVAGYYMCTLGEVMRFALPASLKPRGGSSEELSGGEYRPATVKYIVLAGDIDSQERLCEVCDGLGRSKAQLAALLEFCAASPDRCTAGARVPRRRLSASAAVIAKLIEKGIFAPQEVEAALDAQSAEFDPAAHTLPTLTAPQQEALRAVVERFAERDAVLLHGVTGSGKTEIYMHLIASELAAGRTVLYMMPEIAMTSQLVARVREVFGARVTLYHSRLTDRRRAETYRRLAASRGGELILGVRSSLFLPMPRLGLVIVDEEHDASYKQSEPAPRYYARDCAVWLAREVGAKCLLASATPSIESYVNATSGKYGLVTLPVRYGAGSLPRVVVSDSSRAWRRGERKMHFDKDLLDGMRATLAAGHQVMLFQNRRGFAPWVECPECGWVAHCPRCSVSLTFHKADGTLRCHACGYSQAMVSVCPNCGKAAPRPLGLGTEKVEEELQGLFPEARIARLDRDSAASPAKAAAIVRDFERGDTDILIGTQMITKGFDFPSLTLVGILNADNLLNYPDFRAGERAYQIMTQVSGRAGRSAAAGEVVIQTTEPDNAVIRQVRELDYVGMVRAQLAERSRFGYPPFGRLIVVSLRHRDGDLLAAAADTIAAYMRGAFAERVFGPHAPVIEKLNNENYLEIMLKLENGYSPAAAKKLLGEFIAATAAAKAFRGVFVTVDVDPQ